MSWYPYALAAGLLIVALVLGSRRGGNSIKMRDAIGSDVHAGDTVTRGGAGEGPDKVAWAIGVIGVLIAVASLAHDVWGGG